MKLWLPISHNGFLIPHKRARHSNLPMLSASSRLRPTRVIWQSTQRYSANAAIEELVYPEPNPKHNDLSSFLQHASRTNLNPESTTFVGTRYEYVVQSALERLGLSLRRTGGRGDHGIDLLGTWSVPTMSDPLKVLVQCKALESKVTPDRARELEGAFVGAPRGWAGAGVLAFLVSQKSVTKGVREALLRSRWPLGYIMCSPDGKVIQLLWNSKAKLEGLDGIEVELKYDDTNPKEKEVILTWRGRVLNR